METQNYGIQGGDVNRDVSETMPMLSIYYYFMGLYAIYISDSSDSSITSTSEDEEEDYHSTSNKTSDQGNSFYQSLECMQQFTLMLNSSLLLQLIILICQSISQQPLNFRLHHHLPHQSIVVHLNIQMNHYHLIPNYWIIPLHL